MRLAVLPPRRRIMLRSLGYAAGCGAAVGAAVPLVFGVMAAWFGPDPSVFVVGLVFAPFGAAVGALVGLACGLVAGIALVMLRWQAVGNRTAVRLVAGAAAALPPLAWSIAEWPSWFHTALVLRVLGLTVVTFGLAALCGPRALYGPPGRQDRPRAGAADSAPPDMYRPGSAQSDQML